MTIDSSYLAKMKDHDLLVRVAQAQDDSKDDRREIKRKLDEHTGLIASIKAICEERGQQGLVCPSPTNQKYNRKQIAATTSIGALGVVVLYGIAKLIFAHYGVSI